MIINLKDIILLTLILLKGIFRATVEIAWGIAGLLLLGGMISQYVPNAEAIYQLQNIAIMIYKYLGYFWFASFVLYVQSNWYRLEKYREIEE